MIKPKVLNLQWPTGGISRRYGFQSQPPYTTPFARNVWLNPEGRLRGGSRPGLAKASPTLLGGTPLLLDTISYIPSNTTAAVSKLVVATGSTLYTLAETGANATAAVTSPAMNDLLTIRSAERNQLLYMAIYDEDSTASSASNVPAIYDPVANTTTPWIATDGTLPLGCQCICNWRDRMVLAGGTTSPYGVFFSRQGDPTDWDYGEEDSGAAVNLALADAGQVGEMVTAMHPHADNCLIIGCTSSLWMLQGDPGLGYAAGLRNLSFGIGVVGKNTWCVTPDGWFVFLSNEGLWGIPAECGAAAKPTPLSKHKIPSDLLVPLGTYESRPTAYDSAGYEVSMAYDIKSNGILIFRTPRSSANSDESGVHWFLDWETKSFWDVKFPSARFEPFCCHARRGFVSDKSYVMLGCRDGYVRRFDPDNVKDDEGQDTEATIESKILIGPIMDGSLSSSVLLNHIQPILSRESGPVRWEIYGAASAEEAAHKAENGINPVASGIALANANFKSFPKVRAGAIYIRLMNAGCEAWEFEGMGASITPAGIIRV